MSNPVQLHKPVDHSEFSVDPGSDAPLKFGPRLRRRAPELTLGRGTETSDVAGRPAAKMGAIQAEPRWWMGWIATGAGAAALVLAATAMMAPAVWHVLSVPSEDNVQRAAAAAPSSVRTRAAASAFDPVPYRPIQNGSDKAIIATLARPESSVLLARTGAKDMFAWPPVTPRYPDLSQIFGGAARRVAGIESEPNSSAVEAGSLEGERRSEPVPQTFAPALQPDIAGSPEPVALASSNLPQAMSPRVLIRFAKHSTQSRHRAESLASALAGDGIEVVDLEAAVSPMQPRLSFFYTPDEAIARRVGHFAGMRPARRVQARDGLQLPPGLIELTLAGG